MENNTTWREDALKASRAVNLLSDEIINKVLNTLADETLANIDFILAENQKDLSAMEKSNPMYDRLLLTSDRLKSIANDIRNVASLPSPLGKILEERTLYNGLELTKISVPFGVVGIIYEARPNVSFDVFSLCFKSGNACVLKGGTDAYNSNAAIVALIRKVLAQFNIDENAVILLPAGRQATADLLNAVGFVDVIIPRGGAGLINFVRDNSRVPVIETGAGVCHTYFDEFGDRETGANVINNAKTRRVSVCNALDCLVIHEKRLSDLPYLCEKLAENNVVIEADTKAFTFLSLNYPAALLQKTNADSFGTEFLDYRMSIKTVSGVKEAIEHINTYGSKHSEAIISENAENVALFNKMVDAACVYTNTSTAFSDGAQFGMGAEIGISTQKLHARGPMALPELTSYKFIVKGNGQVRGK